MATTRPRPRPRSAPPGPSGGGGGSSEHRPHAAPAALTKRAPNAAPAHGETRWERRSAARPGARRRATPPSDRGGAGLHWAVWGRGFGKGAWSVGPPGASYRVALGEHNLLQVDGTEYYIDVDAIFIPDDWNPVSIENGYDIALLRLESPANANGFVELGVLPPKGEILPNNYPCYLTGWGLVNVGGSTAERLQEVMLPVVDHEICSQDDWWGSTIKDTMLCAGGDGEKAGCSGDSGGPLSCYRDDHWEVHGIVSFGLVPYCNTYKMPTVFTRVSAYVDWIYSTMENNGGF
ncbi:elastase-1-like [Pithys albifrons albifrons]|uniref:elastase-1-like n=1 Tax=Pithys albifrons albifrons TaxID=3385563 RepID=UPI003A5CFD5F